MNESYAEAVVKKNDDWKSLSLKILIIFGILIGVFLLVFGGTIGMLAVVIIVPLGYYYPKLNIEYEYIFVDGQLDFDAILGKSSRKRLLRINFDQVEVMAPVKSHELDQYNYPNLQIKNYTSGKKDSKPYVIIANSNGKQMKILFEPNEKMLDCIKQKSGKKLFMY